MIWVADEGLYEPTEHHLRRLRERGRGPHSGAARGAAVLAAAGLAAWVAIVLWPKFPGAGLPMAGVKSPALAVQGLDQMARAWVRVAIMAVSLLLVMALAAWTVDAILAGVARQRRVLISRAAFHSKAVWPWLIALLYQIAALFLGYVWLWRAAMAHQADPRRFASTFALSAATAIAVIVLGIAVLDAAVARAAFISSARMTREQFLEEQKETGPPVVVALRRGARLRRRR